MKTSFSGVVRRWHSAVGCFTLLCAVAFLAAPAFGAEEAKKPAAAAASPAAAAPAAATGQPSETEMMKQMMELSKLNDNHKLLARMEGTWDYAVKMWMNPDPKTAPSVSKGVAVRKPIMGGRFFTLDATSMMEMPGADGKMQQMEFKGTALEGYDNVKKKFVSTWSDNMGTGIMMSEGTYDAATKTFTYTSEMEMMPGMKMKVRSTVKMVDSDHHTFEWFEDRGGKEVKTMEINYTRKK